MPVETASFITDLVSANPTTVDPLSQGQIHLTLLKTVLKNTLPNLNGAIYGTPWQFNAAANSFSTTLLDTKLTLAPRTLTSTTMGGGIRWEKGAASATAFESYTDANIWGVYALTASTLTGYVTLGATGNFLASGNINAALKIQEGGFSLIPAGIIVLWTGAIAPGGWTLCNGTAGAPDLRDRFVVGSGSTYAINSLGGSAASTVTSTAAGGFTPAGSLDVQGSHAHGAATGSYALAIGDIPSHSHGVNDPGHTHTLSSLVDNLAGSGSAFGGGVASLQIVGTKTTSVSATGISIQAAGGGLGHSHGISADGAHAHTFTGTAVGNHTHTVTVSLPPYYALAYIMKL